MTNKTENTAEISAVFLVLKNNTDKSAASFVDDTFKSFGELGS